MLNLIFCFAPPCILLNVLFIATYSICFNTKKDSMSKVSLKLISTHYSKQENGKNYSLQHFILHRILDAALLRKK